MERSASDTLEDLTIIYRHIYHLEAGKIIRDISLVWPQLINWIKVEDAENIIPFQFAEPKKLPVGYRIWSLSRHQKECYYAGDFFDCIISLSGKRVRRLQCKLSPEAIKFFKGKHYDY